MADPRILRFRRRARDGTTTPLMTPEQAERISEALIAEKRKPAGRLRAAFMQPPWLYDVKGLTQVEPPARRAAIVREAMRSVNNSWKALLAAGPLLVYAAIAAFGKEPKGVAPNFALGVGLALPVAALHARFVRRKIAELVARELDREPGGL